jgi:RNA recognition motif-containing protein
VEYADKRDAEDALEQENGQYLGGQRIRVEWAKGSIRRSDECFRCGEPGFFFII